MATVTVNFTPSTLWPGTTNIPEMVNIAGFNPVIGWAFDDASDEVLYTEAIYLANYGSGLFRADIDWYSRSGQTSGNAVFDVCVQCITPGDAQSVETDGFAAVSSQAATVNSTAKGDTRTTITSIANDSAAAGDTVIFRLRRAGSNGADTLTGDAIVRSFTISYSDT